MGLESATYIGGLVSAYPTGLDLRSEGDNHLRLIKEVLQNTFPNLNEAVDFGAFCRCPEIVYATNQILDPSNGTIQYINLSGPITFYENFPSGGAITLMVGGNGNMVTWPNMVWVNNAGFSPTLAPLGYTVVTLWKVGSNFYGALVGNGF